MHLLNSVHVDAVYIRALLAIHLDGNEQFIHQASGLLVLERFMLHHVTPVARGVAYGDQHGFVLGCCLLESLRAPRIPIHGVLGVLKQIRRRFVD